MKSKDTFPGYIRPAAAAELLGVSKATIYRKIEAGQIDRYTDLMGKTVLKMEDLEPKRA